MMNLPAIDNYPPYLTVMAWMIVAMATTMNFQSCEAYVLTIRPQVRTFGTFTTTSSFPCIDDTKRMTLYAEAGDEHERKPMAEQQQGEEEMAADAEEEEAEDEEGDEEAEDGEEDEEAEEDPEVVALKETIADLEATFKEKKSKVQYLRDQAEQYSKGGYARKVAEMETMRRARSVSSTNVLIVCRKVSLSYIAINDLRMIISVFDFLFLVRWQCIVFNVNITKILSSTLLTSKTGSPWRLQTRKQVLPMF